MYPVTMSTGTPAATTDSKQKSEQEKKRREKSNLKFAELQQLVSTEGKMSQDEILKVAFKRATKIKKQSESDPFTQGIYASVEKTEQLTIQHVKSLNLPSDTQNTKVEALKELFYKFYDGDAAIPVTPLTPTTSTSVVEDLKKEIKKNREQERRDRHKNGYDSLKQFLIENNYLSSSSKIEKIHILEATIRFISRANSTIQPCLVNAAKFAEGIELGKYLGSTLAAGFYTYDLLLPLKNVELQNIIVAQLGPILPPPPHLVSAILANALLTPPASAPPSGSDGSSDSSSDDNCNQAPVPAVAPVSAPLSVPKLFRPWEKSP